MKTRKQTSVASLLLILFVLFGGCATRNKSIVLPGRTGEQILLPNGWKLKPAGAQVAVGEFPMNMVVRRDGRYAVTSNSGTAEHSLSVIDVTQMKETQRFKLDNTWRGLALDEKHARLFVSGGNANVVYVFRFLDGVLSLQDSIVLGKRFPKERISVAGICYLEYSDMLVVVSRYDKAVRFFSVSEKTEAAKIATAEQCYDVCDAGDGKHVFVSVWGSAQVWKINTKDFSVTAKISTAAHPCEMAVSKSSGRLFTACANTNAVSVIDIEAAKETERLIASLHPDDPPGSTPNSLCFDEDEERLFVANADNNCLAVFDIREKGTSRSVGFIPAGWYPTAVRFDSRSERIIVANGKGGASRANPMGPNPYKKNDGDATEYIGSLFKGSVSVIPNHDAEQLARWSADAYAGRPLPPQRVAEQSIIPMTHEAGGSRGLRHVFYIIKENRTYDQVYGDLPRGNGDSALCLFPRRITPNQHALAETYTLFDNFYVDAEVSADGHNWSTAAYATDYVEKNWPVYYGGRGGSYEFEGGSPIAAPSSGYIWDAALRAGKTIRDYGEFTQRVIRGDDTLYEARDERLAPYVCERYPSYDLTISDLKRFEIWKEDFDKLCAADSLPNLSIIRLPNNHTMGTRKGALSPTAYVAQNDYALGLMVQHISRSAYWKNSIIFVLEDDAQNGADHIDAHRSCLLVIGPHVKNGFVDHTMYSTSGVLKTIELILGVPPMTQYDLLATPTVYCLNDTPVLKPFESLVPAVDLEERNPPHAFGAAECGEMDFEHIDAVPDRRFNEILWKAIKGSSSEMPPPVRSAYVRAAAGEPDED